MLCMSKLYGLAPTTGKVDLQYSMQCFIIMAVWSMYFLSNVLFGVTSIIFLICVFGLTSVYMHCPPQECKSIQLTATGLYCGIVGTNGYRRSSGGCNSGGLCDILRCANYLMKC